MKNFLTNIIIELGNKGNREIRENRACFNFKTLALHYSCISLIPLYPYSPYTIFNIYPRSHVIGIN